MRNRTNGATQLAKRFIFAIAAGLALAAVAFLVIGRDRIDCDTYRFDAGAWRAAKAAGPAGEEQVKEAAENVARCGVFDGRPVAVLRAKLGRPTSASPGSWAYYLVKEPGIGPAWLSFNVGRDGRVTASGVSAM